MIEYRYILTLILISIFYLAKGFQDLAMKNVFKIAKFNVKNSWKFKYKNGLEHYTEKWYYFRTHNPYYAEKFPFSSTYFVFTTDLWHFMDFIRTNSMYLIIYLWSGSISILVVSKLVQWISFNVIYNRK